MLARRDDDHAIPTKLTSNAVASPSITETKLLCLAGEFGVHRNKRDSMNRRARTSGMPLKAYCVFMP